MIKVLLFLVMVGLLFSDGAFGQKGNYAVIVNAPPHFVKTEMIAVERILERIIIDESIDSLRCVERTAKHLYPEGTNIILYFEEKGEGTILSERVCSGFDCETENPIAIQNANTIRSSLQIISTAIEKDYVTSGQKNRDSLLVIQKREDSARTAVIRQKMDDQLKAQKALRFAELIEKTGRDADSIRIALEGKILWLWSRYQLQPYLSHYKVTSVNVVATGHPRVDYKSEDNYPDSEAIIEISLRGDTGETFTISPQECDNQYSLASPYKLHPKWSPRIWKAIESESVVIGMTTEQARMAWGNPDHINRSTTRRGTSEQWVYSSGSYLYFSNGLLDSIQN